jgi:glycosyltransferase involved in cell wall biosynthesis
VNYKGLSLLLKAVRHVSSDYHLIIAGQGRLAGQLHRKIVRCRLEEKVSVMTPNIAIDRLLDVSDMAILCSNREAQPYFLLEAMMAGCPVIATDVPGNRELLMNQRGLLVPPEAREIAKGIEKMLTDPALRESFAESAYRYVSSRHRLERQVERLAEIYRTHLKQSTLHGAKLRTDVTAALNKKAV